jgi:hypothetical protein
MADTTQPKPIPATREFSLIPCNFYESIEVEAPADSKVGSVIEHEGKRWRVAERVDRTHGRRPILVCTAADAKAGW